MDDRRHSTGAIITSWVVTVLTGGYMLPWAIATSRDKANHVVVGLITFLLGWTVVGWIVALVMALGPHRPLASGHPGHQRY